MQGPAQAMRHITVTGHGEVETVPDMGVLQLGVTEQSAEPQAAMDAASDVAARILERLTGEGIAERDVQTSQISLNPVWSDRPNEYGERAITGYEATQTVTVRVRELDRLGEVMSAVVADGANRLNGLQLTLQDPDPVTDEARRRAVEDARARAELYAEAAGVKLGEIRAISEPGNGGGYPRPMMEAAFARAGDSAPVAPGEITISADIDMVFGIAGDAPAE
ncbi:DUF541 domain-containing protein [Aquicoccus sp. SCR17]|nr:DUF541 domain-containing protein [Carideicomes alvinocaridis]